MKESPPCLARNDRSTRSPGPSNSSPSTSASSARRPAPPATANSAGSATTPPAHWPTPPAACGYPSLAVTLGFVRACGGDEDAWERRWRAIGETSAEEAETASPYVGLKAFTEQDADRFFGRERLVGKLVAKLEQHDTVLVVGASGSGKSSLLRAGLLARQDGELITPGTHRTLPRTDGLLVVDQFEEIFTLPGRDEFIAGLTQREGKTVIGVRADFYGHCARYPELADGRRGGAGRGRADDHRRAAERPSPSPPSRSAARWRPVSSPGS